MTRIAAPQLSFADLELRNQGVHLDPLLQGIAGFLDDHATLIEQVRQDLARGLKNPTPDAVASLPRRPCARSS
jgi:ABC-type transporter Mla subunit MlaD